MHGCMDACIQSLVLQSCMGFQYSLIVCHTEYNAIINKGAVDPRGCTLYVTLFPCHECAKLLIQSGITKIVYVEGKERADARDHAASTYELSRILLERAGVSLWYVQLYSSELFNILIWLIHVINTASSKRQSLH